MKLPNNLGMLLVAIWFMLEGAIGLFHFSFEALPLVMAIIALAAGILLLFQRQMPH